MFAKTHTWFLAFWPVKLTKASSDLNILGGIIFSGIDLPRKPKKLFFKQFYTWLAFKVWKCQKEALKGPDE